MSTKYLKFLSLLFLLMFTGCATLDQEDCLQASWYELGVSDGRAGKTFDLLADHQDACSEYGVKINSAEYNAGRQEGLKSYCQLDNAVDTGLRGEKYQSICPTHIDHQFREYNNAAYEVYDSRNSLEEIDDKLNQKEDKLLEDKLTDDEKSKIRVELRKLDRERQRLRDDLYTNERRLDYLLHER